MMTSDKSQDELRQQILDALINDPSISLGCSLNGDLIEPETAINSLLNLIADARYQQDKQIMKTKTLCTYCHKYTVTDTSPKPIEGRTSPFRYCHWCGEEKFARPTATGTEGSEQ